MNSTLTFLQAVALSCCPAFVAQVLICLCSSALPLLTMTAVFVIPDYFTPAMLGLKMDQEVLGELVKVKIPTVWQTMMDNNVTWTLVVSRWFICLYIDVLPVEVSVSWCSQQRNPAIVTAVYLFYLVSGLGSFCHQMNNRLRGKSGVIVVHLVQHTGAK